jgi:hypothetical protein
MNDVLSFLNEFANAHIIDLVLAVHILVVGWLLARIGLGKEPAEGERTSSEVVGYLVLVGIMLFATIEAVRLLGFEVLAGLLAGFMVFAGHVLLGLIVFGLGLFLADLVARTVEASGKTQARLLAVAARVSIAANTCGASSPVSPSCQG